MARWVSVDVRQLKALQKRLDRLQKVDLDQFAATMVGELAARMLRQVKKRTPVVTGTLHNNWAVTSVVKIGDNYEIEVFNSKNYAACVEYGHRQQPGRFIPGYWESGRFVYDPNAKGGMVLKNSWTEGRYMMTISAQELQRDAPRIIEKKLIQLLAKELEG